MPHIWTESCVICINDNDKSKIIGINNWASKYCRSRDKHCALKNQSCCVPWKLIIVQCSVQEVLNERKMTIYMKHVTCVKRPVTGIESLEDSTHLFLKSVSIGQGRIPLDFCFPLWPIPCLALPCLSFPFLSFPFLWFPFLSSPLFCFTFPFLSFSLGYFWSKVFLVMAYTVLNLQLARI